MTLDEARQIAAQAWCDQETSGIEMDVRLAEAFARRLVEAADEALEDAAGIVEAADGDPECGCDRCDARRNAVSWATREIRARKSKSGGGTASIDDLAGLTDVMRGGGSSREGGAP